MDGLCGFVSTESMSSCLCCVMRSHLPIALTSLGFHRPVKTLLWMRRAFNQHSTGESLGEEPVFG